VGRGTPPTPPARNPVARIVGESGGAENPDAQTHWVDDTERGRHKSSGYFYPLGLGLWGFWYCDKCDKVAQTFWVSDNPSGSQNQGEKAHWVDEKRRLIVSTGFLRASVTSGLRAGGENLRLF